MANGITPTTLSSQIGQTHTTENRTPKQELGKDEFLQLLTTEMSNQDPMSPMDNTEFIAQMAQFSSLEQMQQLNTSYVTSQAYSLIGKNVVGSMPGMGQILGTVTGTVRQNKTDYLMIGDYKLPLTNVTEVYDTGHENNSLIAQSSHLIGKYIKATVPSDQTDITTGETVTVNAEIEGEVETILMKDFTVYAKLKGTGKEVPVSYITEINGVKATDGSTNGTDSSEGAGDSTTSGTDSSEDAVDGSTGDEGFEEA